MVRTMFKEVVITDKRTYREMQTDTGCAGIYPHSQQSLLISGLTSQPFWIERAKIAALIAFLNLVQGTLIAEEEEAAANVGTS